MIAIDLETHLITPGNQAPKIVVLAVYDPDNSMSRDVEAGFEPSEPFLVKGKDAILRTMLTVLSVGPICGHNIAFDLSALMQAYPGLIGAIFRAYRNNKVWCTQTAEQLLAAAQGTFKFEKGKRKEYNLAAVVKKYLGENVAGKGDDAWRMRYAELENTPLSKWPEAAIEYPKNDVIYAYRVWEAQLYQGLCVQGTLIGAARDQAIYNGFLPTWTVQVRAAQYLHLMGCHGICVDESQIDIVEPMLSEVVEETKEELKAAEIYRENRKGALSLNTKLVQEKVQSALGDSTPTTPTGKPKRDEETLRATGDLELIKLADISGDKKLLETYIPLLRKGAREGAIHAWWNILVETGRTSCRFPNLQNQPRRGGIRECFVARPGHVIVASDYDVAELCSLGQVCLKLFGYSELANTINAGRDPHKWFGAALMGISYDEFEERYANKDTDCKNHRQFAKVANFGYPGGLGARTFKSYAANFGVHVTEEQSYELKDGWEETFPELPEYLSYISDLCGGYGKKYTAVHPITGYVRKGVSYTEGANFNFQHLTATGAKEAMCMIMEAQYWDTSSPLYGTRPLAFIHDELLIEVPEGQAHEAAQELERMMVAGMARWVPDVRLGATAHAMRAWHKDAEPVFGEDGRLTPWEP